MDNKATTIVAGIAALGLVISSFVLGDAVKNRNKAD